MFTQSFEKTAVLEGALVGAIGGGEKDHKEGGKKNRWIGALRGASAQTGVGLGALAGIAATKKGRGLVKDLIKHRANGQKSLELGVHHGMSMTKADKAKMLAGVAGGSVAGGVAGYKAMKHIGPKYDKDKK
jgi:hypothetical protein